MDVERLRGCFGPLKDEAAPGIDGRTKAEYAARLEENLAVLVRRLHTMSYAPQPVRRVSIPKPGSGKLRPLGIPAIEDKLAQAGRARILEAVYEQDFIADSYGFGPGLGCGTSGAGLRGGRGGNAMECGSGHQRILG